MLCVMNILVYILLTYQHLSLGNDIFYLYIIHLFFSCESMQLLLRITPISFAAFIHPIIRSSGSLLQKARGSSVLLKCTLALTINYSGSQAKSLRSRTVTENRTLSSEVREPNSCHWTSRERSGLLFGGCQQGVHWLEQEVATACYHQHKANTHSHSAVQCCFSLSPLLALSCWHLPLFTLVCTLLFLFL